MTARNLLAAVYLIMAAPVVAGETATIIGPSRVIDGDSVVVGGTQIRLRGVDAAERGTVLGEIARSVMIAIVAGGELRCALTGERTWRREVGYCWPRLPTICG